MAIPVKSGQIFYIHEMATMIIEVNNALPNSVHKCSSREAVSQKEDSEDSSLLSTLETLTPTPTFNGVLFLTNESGGGLFTEQPWQSRG